MWAACRATRAIRVNSCCEAAAGGSVRGMTAMVPRVSSPMVETNRMKTGLVTNPTMFATTPTLTADDATETWAAAAVKFGERVTPIAGRWKITGLELLNEARLQ